MIILFERCWVYSHAALLLQVERLQGVVRDRRANWGQSIATLEAAKAAGVRVTKTSLMLGCGEAPHEVVAALRALRDAGARSETPHAAASPLSCKRALSRASCRANC